MLATLEIIWGALVTGYLDEHRAVYGEQRQARDAIRDPAAPKTGSYRRT
jgi:hypothetical protein